MIYFIDIIILLYCGVSRNKFVKYKQNFDKDQDVERRVVNKLN